MKKVELEKLIAEAILESGYLPQEDSDNLAGFVAKQIAPKLVVKKKMIISGSIDDCPEYSIHHIDEDISELLHYAEEDDDGFDKDDLETTLEFNLIEDFEKYERIQKLLSVIPHCKTRKEAEEIQDEINEIEGSI